MDAPLQVGAVTQTMEVTAEIPMLKTERADVATSFDERYVQELPLLNRNFTQFQLLTPGSQRLGWQHAASENPQGSIQILMNGQHFSGTACQLDGTDNRDAIPGIIVINPNFDSISEAKVTSQNYDADRRPGGFLDPSTGEVLIAGSPGIGLNGEVSNTFTNFAPRFGLAYQVTPATVIRVGCGGSFDVGVFGSLFGHSVTQNLPVLAQQENVPANNFENLGNPDSCVDCGNGGKIFGLVPGANQRQLQFALRFEF